MESGGQLWSQASGAWSLKDSGVSTLFVSPNGTVAELETNASLWTNDTVTGWSAVRDTKAIQITVAADGALVVLDNDQTSGFP